MYFFVPDLEKTTIQGPAADHLFSTRVEAGERVTLTNLKGTIAEVEITDVAKKQHSVQWNILRTLQPISTLANRILIQAEPDKAYVEKMAEILPLQAGTLLIFASDYSPKQTLNLQRLEKIVIRACELGEVAHKPTIEVVSKAKAYQYLEHQEAAVLACTSDAVDFNSQDESPKSAILVGPEGGWSPQEIADFQTYQTPFISLGQQIFPAWLAGYTYFARFST
jgi:RsmE family RNA methyltransferase